MFPTLSGHEEHEEYVHGFHLPLVRDFQRVRAWGHEDIDCGESHAEAIAVPFYPIPKTSPVPSIPSFPLKYLGFPDTARLDEFLDPTR